MRRGEGVNIYDGFKDVDVTQDFVRIISGGEINGKIKSKEEMTR